MKTYLGIDIGGTAVKLGLVTEAGEVLLRSETSVSFDGYRTPILDTVRAAAVWMLRSRKIPFRPSKHPDYIASSATMPSGISW